MSTSKRRRLNIEEPPQPMSAFALRKRLLAQQGQAASAPTDEAQVAEVAISTDNNEIAATPPKKARKTRSTRHAPPQREEVSSRSGRPSPAQGPVDLSGNPPSQVEQEAVSPSPFHSEGADQDYDASSPVQHVNVNLSSFRPSKGNFRRKGNGILQLSLEGGERLLILGSYGIRTKSGEVTIYGATLKPSEEVLWVHALQSHALPAIRCVDDATLELHPHPGAQGLKALGSLSPLFRKLWWENPISFSQDQTSAPEETFRILYTSEDVPKRAILQDLKSSPEWNRELARLATPGGPGPLSIMITGPKSSGKSTFGRILVNRLLTSVYTRTKRPNHSGVVVIDLDPGQPEYGSVGHVSLVLVTKPILSPSFCRPLDTPGARVIRSHALASLSPASDPALYTEMAIDLIAHYRNAFGSYPLIINTPGWIQGTGLDLLVSLLSELRPSDVIYMSQMGPADTVEALEGVCNMTRFSTLPSQPSQPIFRTATDLRAMQTMAYFHAEPKKQKDDDGDGLGWFQGPLTGMAPWQVRFRGAGRGIFGILYYDFQTQPDLVADSINGTILAAVEVESTRAFRDIENSYFASSGVDSEAPPGSPMELDTDRTEQALIPSLSLLWDKITTLTADGIPFVDTSHGLTLDPRYSRSLGMVLVRGIDVERGDLQLLSPITTSQVEDARARGSQIVLVSGKLDPPSWAYMEDLHLRSDQDGVHASEGNDSDNQPKDNEVDSENMKGEDITTFYANAESVPWIEVLTRNQRRGAGSKVWRVRRDLGRVGNSTI